MHPSVDVWECRRLRHNVSSPHPGEDEVQSRYRILPAKEVASWSRHDGVNVPQVQENPRIFYRVICLPKKWPHIALGEGLGTELRQGRMSGSWCLLTKHRMEPPPGSSKHHPLQASRRISDQVEMGTPHDSSIPAQPKQNHSIPQTWCGLRYLMNTRPSGYVNEQGEDRHRRGKGTDWSPCQLPGGRASLGVPFYKP